MSYVFGILGLAALSALWIVIQRAADPRGSEARGGRCGACAGSGSCQGSGQGPGCDKAPTEA